MQTDARFETFLNTLAQPLQLNEMRSNMKGENYPMMRKLLSNFLGSPILRLIKDNQEALELDPEVFDLVYEGFWDLYTIRDNQLRDVSARKLQAWIAKIKLQSGPDRSPPAGEEKEEVKAAAEGSGEEGEEGGAGEEKKSAINFDAEDTIDNIAAVVRIKIPKVDPVFEQDEEGNDIIVEVNESELEDIPFEDKCLTLQAKQEDQNIWVINHLVQKTLRQEISAEFR